MQKQITQLKSILYNAQKIVVFTGAGISAESGIPTYRGAGGVWSKYNPDIYANINVFMQDSTYYWQYFRDERYPLIKKSKPNQTHYVIAKLEKQGKILRVITQNIDGLHQQAGTSNVIELHGNTREITCLKCRKTYSIDEIYNQLQTRLPPSCQCGGRLKTNTILFGEPLPQTALTQAHIAAQQCDLFLVLGSSLVVYPAAQLPVIAKNNGAFLVIINIDPTPYDELADIVIHSKTSTILEKVVS